MSQFHITFHSKSKDDRARALSNFSEHEVEVDNVKFNSGEHAFQTIKFTHAAAVTTNEQRRMRLMQHAAKVKDSLLPMDAKTLGSKGGKGGMKLTQFEIQKWHEAAPVVQRQICESKIELHPQIYEFLLSTETKLLLHHELGPTPYWGGRLEKETEQVIGENTLGQIWMQLRKKELY